MSTIEGEEGLGTRLLVGHYKSIYYTRLMSMVILIKQTVQ